MCWEVTASCENPLYFGETWYRHTLYLWHVLTPFIITLLRGRSITCKRSSYSLSVPFPPPGSEIKVQGHWITAQIHCLISHNVRCKRPVHWFNHSFSHHSRWESSKDYFLVCMHMCMWVHTCVGMWSPNIDTGFLSQLLPTRVSSLSRELNSLVRLPSQWAHGIRLSLLFS